MREKNTLQSKFRKIIILILLSFFLLLALAFYFFAKNQIESKFEHEALGVVNYTHLMLTEIFEDAERGIDAVANHAINQSDYASFLNSIYTTINSANTLYIGNYKGEFYLYPNRYVADDFDPRSREWYINAVENHTNIVWSNPYIDHGTGEFTVSASKVFKDNTNMDAVVGVDLLLNDLKKSVEDVVVGEKGYVSIINSNGDIIAHKDADKLALNSDDSSLFERSYDDLISSSDKGVTEGISHIYYVKSFEKGNLFIIATVFKSDVQKNLIFLYSVLIIFLIIISIVSERVAFKYAKKITSPILNLRDVMMKFSEGNYEVKCALETDDEIGYLIDGFNRMTENIYENKMETQALYEELYASEETLKEQYDLLYENKENIRKSEERYRFIFEASKEGLWDSDSKWNTTYLTPSWYDKFGFNAWDVRMRQWRNMIHPEDRDRIDKELDAHLKGETDVYQTEYRIICGDGSTAWIEVVGKARFDENGEFIGMSGSHTDISVRKNYELRMKNMAYKDNLTQLYNRRYFDEQLDAYITSGGEGTLLFIDINNFKYINDVYGHVFGDEVLVELARRLEILFSDPSKFMIARFSGDEYIILMKGITNQKEIVHYLNELTMTIENPIQRIKKRFKVTASIGVTSFPNDGKERVELLQNADIAMYYAKRVSKKNYHFFDDEIRTQTINELEIENNLREALLLNELEVHYQPIVSNRTKKIESFEALIRWNSTKLGYIYPDAFIPIAEKTGLIIDIGAFVLEKACSFIADLNRRSEMKYGVSVNISVVQLMEDHFASQVLQIVEASQLPKDLLTLEITESMMMEGNENILAKIFYLKNQNIGISLDDFGTGYSSFNNLIRLPLSYIKLDRSVMKDSIVNENVFKLLESVVIFAHKAGIEVVAEGIENDDYLKRSDAMGIDFLQGYYFSRPVGESQVKKILNK
ncbi:EAL domain-containing protein [Fusibacter tunisiensis]|uniref:Diguanylate cyclase (GGDEF)-like protein/PAS domain S-box-containing protein n=1 Tax=Fusibacter tunisiensis TaxID=1008308 RepID=A0ABS2MNN5_9FIRM|nr:EAL domain-containing protein [Fusibacter tunisiensis]MBM7561014.1 diguanylate cyclase (GGDEF)-like protein/PAS domain S-box-containing protein [Fusibacter tunisiensis]